MALRIGSKVTMTEHAIANYGEEYRGIVLKINHIARSVEEHQGYDSGMLGEPLYSFDNAEYSLYSYEVESISKT